MNGDTTRGVGIGLLIGAAIGLAAGILYAPQPGPDTRHLLREKADAASSRIHDVAGKVKDRFHRETGEEMD
jgi:gas vesicle protein